MKFGGYKYLLEHLNKTKQVVVTVSLWTYSSKRQIFRIPFDEAKKYFDKDMIWSAYSRKFKFTATNGKPFSFGENTLKIVKVDSVDIK
jgi:hypothetical protein